MFRVKETDDPSGYPVAFGAVLVAVTSALLVNISCIYLVVRQSRFVNAWESAASTGALPEAQSLRLAIRSVLILSALMAVALVLSIAAHGWLWRRYLAYRESLRQVKMLAHNILASMDHGVITTDPENCITSINTAAILLLGVDFECVGQPLSQIQSADLPLTNMSHRVMAGQGPIWDQDFSIHRNGRVQRLLGDAHILKDADGQQLGCVIHLRDVTERVLMEARMSRMERFISLGSLASGLHHEIKNPLTALSIHVQLLEERLRQPESTEPVHELLGVLKTEIHRLNGVLESFRSFTNLQRLNLQPTDVLDVLENVIRLVRPQAAQQNVQITLHHPDKMLASISLDAEKFEQAILNLMINALEAMPAGGTLSISVIVQDDLLHVEVVDTGTGIPEEIRPSVFKPYFSTKDRGTGMGLALTEKLVGQHGGHINYQTGATGTTFRLSLPMVHESTVP